MSSTTTGMRTALAVAALLALSATGDAAARGDAEAGRQKAQVCQACHGEDGNGIGDGQYPLLAGQYADYLVFALKAYKAGTRQNAIMSGFVAPLSDQDMQDLAAFYASQPGRLTDLSHLK